MAGLPSSTTTTSINSPGSSTPVNSTTNNTGASPLTQGGMSLDDVKNIWIQAGGNPQAADMAAAVADAESGLNPNATRTDPDGTSSVGLWLIPKNGTPSGSTDPLSNARAAIQLSNNGTDWSQWCVAWSDNNCGCDGGTYLGEGSNALGSLGSQLTPSSYNVIGSAPTGAGTSASTASSGTATTTASSSLSKYLWIGVLVGAVVFVFIMTRRKTGSGTGSEGSSWTPEETSALSGDESDTDLASRLGRSRHAIHVKRSRMKSDSDYTH